MLVPLYIFLMVPVPIAAGFVIALVLRELYIRQGGTFESAQTNERESAVSAANEPAEPNEQESVISAANEPVEPNEQESVIPTTNEPAEPNEQESVIPAVAENAITTESAAENAPEPEPPVLSKNIFDDAAPSPPDLHINNALEEMLDDANPVVPSDLSSRLAEETAEILEINEDDDGSGIWNEDEDDIMSRLQDNAGEQNITFSDADVNEDGIAATAAEILGADFDFDALVNQKYGTEQPENTEETQETQNTVENADEEAFCADTFVPFNGDVPQELESERQDIVSSFPADLVSDAAVEPDYTAAERFCFTEELRPMFVPKKRKIQ
ncbi:MAG: hypothetical protein LBN39_00910 [Planctomycetaceae bacterium]|jgi:hypothetical protein|nr:hypothetical protein [Planctomycetaceae bacterium]